MTNPDARRAAVDEWMICGLIFLAAAVVRLLFLNELSGSSYLGNIRVSDADTYFDVANQILSGTLDPEMPFWQAPLYPILLAGFQAVFGESLRAIQFSHIIIGSLSCVLVHRLTLRLFGLPSAVVVAVFAVFYAPFWLFDIQPLPANITMLLDLILASVFMTYCDRGGLWRIGVVGLLLGGAIISHGLAIFTVPVFVFYGWQHTRSEPGSGVGRAVSLAVFLALLALPPAAVSLRNSRAAGEAVFISYNAGINLFVGNSPDLEDTLMRRGGYEWHDLFRDAYASGAKKPAAQNRYFANKALRGFVESPGDVFATQLKKVFLVFSASETKRNFPIYPLRNDSRLLAVFLYQVEIGGAVVFAFPAGLMLPLLILGLVIAFKNAPRASAIQLLPGWVALFHVLGMIVFFPTARYRVPALILLMPYGAALFVAILDRVRVTIAAGRAPKPMGVGWDLGRPARLAAVAAILFGATNGIGTNILRDPIKNTAEDHHLNAVWGFREFVAKRQSSSLKRWVDRATKAREVDSTYPDPAYMLAVYYLERDYPRAMALFEELERMLPGNKELLADIRKAERFAPTP